ncbi:MAG: type II toxin-antitoxin system RelB/DinJ family antitoxin [Candidatus Peribacteraceae bacterium]|nr:type II toxin-antitoxin system RelB/DinJ family antitoxin [Candidatus Peribacteraceae bacterium]
MPPSPMPSGRIQHRIHPSLQRDAEEILRTQGIKPSQAIILFYTEVKRFGGLPFTPSPVRPSEIPNRRLQRDLKNASRKKGIMTYKNKRELVDSLRAGKP